MTKVVAFTALFCLGSTSWAGESAYKSPYWILSSLSVMLLDPFAQSEARFGMGIPEDARVEAAQAMLLDHVSKSEKCFQNEKSDPKRFADCLFASSSSLQEGLWTAAVGDRRAPRCR